MDISQTSDELLAHFDRPKLLEMPDFEWVDDVAPADLAGVSVSVAPSVPAIERYIEVPRDTRRGVGWVLAWAGAIAVLFVAASVLIEFAYVLSAEHALSI